MASFLVIAALLLFARFSVSYAQQISDTQIEGQVGENVMFTCTSVDPGDGANILLEVQNMNGLFEIFDTTPLASGRLFMNSSGDIASYSFGPLRSSDNGLVLRCTSSGISTPNAMISVIFVAMITNVNPDNRTITFVENQGEAFNLTLTVEGNPTPTYNWTKNGEIVTNGSTLTVTSNSFSAYLVRENTGFYEVVYTNSLGRVSHNFTLNIQYQSEFPANAIMDSPETVCEERSGVYVCTARTGSRVTLLCNAMGNPPPVVTFTPANVPRNGNIIVFPVVAMTDAGNYTCTASSAGFNDVQRRFLLVVAGPPGPVSELTTTINLDEGTITFTWTYDDSLSGVPITGFIITITKDIGGADPITMELPPDQLLFTLPLSRFMNQMSYTASVTVRSIQGSSEPIFDDPFMIPDSSTDNMGQGALGAGAIAGIVIGVLVGVILLILVVVAILAVYFNKKK